MSEASDRLNREADEIRALAQEHGESLTFGLAELILRIVARALDEQTEREAA